LMLAQRFPTAQIDAVEIDQASALTSQRNFEGSSFHSRLQVFQEDVFEFFSNHPHKKYDLIISNPPFYIHALKPKNKTGELAKHTDELFFEKLIKSVANHLSSDGTCCLILPITTKVLVEHLVIDNNLYINEIINIKSFSDTPSHRNILFFGPRKRNFIEKELVIYAQAGRYTDAYRETLKDFLTIF
jgi:tRNA1Val (adenine37-N6)-methyltransferase